MKPFKIVNLYVYVVLEHIDGQDSILHGVYTEKGEAQGKYIRLLQKTRDKSRYICVLKKPLHGRCRNITIRGF